MTRKINLPAYCSPRTGQSSGGIEDCDHDYPPDSKIEYSNLVKWQCSKCGMTRSYEVYQ
jgi:hypothetical protein